MVSEDKWAWIAIGSWGGGGGLKMKQYRYIHTFPSSHVHAFPWLRSWRKKQLVALSNEKEACSSGNYYDLQPL